MLALILTLHLLPSALAQTVRLTSVSESFYVNRLYQRLKNEDPPSASDPALSEPRIRKQICDDVTTSGLFETFYHMHPVNEKKIYPELREPRNRFIFQQIYSPRKNRLERLLSRRQEYTNNFVQKAFTINHTFHDPLNANEYVFMCLFKRRYSNSLVFSYVSKEYNLNEGNQGQPVKVGRFVFLGRREESDMYLMLAEESAWTYNHLRLDFNVEMHYLQIRNYRRPVRNPEEDPICKLALSGRENNQHCRLCTAVLTSEFFKDRVKYPLQMDSSNCCEEEISFRTEAAVQEAAGRTYREHVLSCFAESATSGRFKFYFISRAYRSNQVFVYQFDVSLRKMYLENVSTNLNMVLERASFNFDDVE